MRIHPFIFACAANFFWAGNAIIGKIAANAIPAFTLNFWRWILAALILCPFTFRKFRRQRSWYRENFWFVSGMAFLSVSLYNSLQYLALTYTSPGNVGIVGASAPMFVLLLNAWLNRQKIRVNQVAGIILAMGGVVFVLLSGGGVVLALNPGDVIMLTATIGFSLYSVLLKRIPGHIDAGGLLFVLMALGVIGILPFYAVDLIQGRTWEWQSGSSGLILLYVAIFPSIASFFFWNLAVKKGGAILTGLSFNLLPVFTIILAVVILGDPVLKSQILAVILVFAGIATGLLPRKNRDEG